MAEEHPKIMVRPLPQIIDEIEANIGTATEAARRAEEAARAAREAAGAATKASEEAGKRATEARKAERTVKVAIAAAEEATRKAEETAATILQRIELLEKRLKSLENALPKEEVVVLREISKEEAEKEILELFSKGQTLYYSDIAEQLGLDLKLVVEICNELQSRGEIEVVDDLLQRR
jgi:chromosome segregation ATPase